jgi:hypothetical protein
MKGQIKTLVIIFNIPMDRKESSKHVDVEHTGKLATILEIKADRGYSELHFSAESHEVKRTGYRLFHPSCEFLPRGARMKNEYDF